MLRFEGNHEVSSSDRLMGIPTTSSLILMGAAPDLRKQRYVHLGAEGRAGRDPYTTVAINYVDDQFDLQFYKKSDDRAKKYELGMNGPIAWPPVISKVDTERNPPGAVQAQCENK